MPLTFVQPFHLCLGMLSNGPGSALVQLQEDDPPHFSAGTIGFVRQRIDAIDEVSDRCCETNPESCSGQKSAQRMQRDIRSAGPLSYKTSKLAGGRADAEDALENQLLPEPAP